MKKAPSVYDYIFFFSILIIIVVFIIFRYSIFPHYNYGKYVKEISHPCLTESGKCNQTGYTTNIERCERNLGTGRGCLNKGKQTFSYNIERVGCLKNCQSSIFVIDSLSQCVYDQPCINKEDVDKIVGKREKTEKCIPWDAYGVNNCTYNLINETIPDKCQKNDFTITCEVDATYKVIESCNTDFTICSDKGVIEDNVSYLCKDFTPSSYLSSSCRSYETGEIYDNDIYTLHSGFMKFKEACLGSVCKEGESYCIKPCLYYPEKITSWSDRIVNVLEHINVIENIKPYLIFRPVRNMSFKELQVNILYINKEDRGYLYINEKNAVSFFPFNFDETHVDEIMEENAIFILRDNDSSFDIRNINNQGITAAQVPLNEVDISSIGLIKDYI
jgi:hypothetical protein